MEREIVTVLVEPNLLVREGLVRILAGTQFEVQAHASSLGELRLSAHDSPSMFIIAAPDQASAGEDPIVQVRNEHPSAWIVFLAPSNDAARCLDALRAGANAVLTQQLSADALVKSLELVTLGLLAIPTDLLKALLGQRHEAVLPRQPEIREAQLANMDHGGPLLRSRREVPLSSRELNILGCIQKGSSNKLIAREYDIAEATVKVHVKSILRKIGAANRTQAAIWAMNQTQRKADKVIYPEPSEVQ